MLTLRTIKFISAFVGLLILGLLLGNRIILAMSLIPFSLAVIGLLVQPPEHIKIKSQKNLSKAQVGEIVEISYSIIVSRGVGSFSLFQELPSNFALVKGNNLRVFWKGWRPGTYDFAYSLRCTKRGIYTLPPIKFESDHFLRLMPTYVGQIGEPQEFTVHPRLLNVRRIRGLPGIATTPFPVIDTAKIGVTTTDFREIREYVYGDPVKNINWKATARSTSPSPWPLTNEYEVEGKKSVWIFLDASKILEVGTSIENTLEYCLEAGNSVLYYFLDRGYRVGMYVFNNGGQLFYPDAEKKQYLKISKELIKIQPGNKIDEFPVAVEKCRRYILGYNPLCVIITRMDNRFSDTIVNGVKKIRQIHGRSRRQLPLMVINVPGYNMLSDDDEYNSNTALLRQIDTRPKIQQLRHLGSSVMEWNPRRESFGNALLAMVKSR